MVMQALILEGKYTGNILTDKLPRELDNALYALIHFIGGLDFTDVNRTIFYEKVHLMIDVLWVRL